MKTAPGSLPLLGHALGLLRDPVQLLQSVRGAGDMARIRIGPLDVYVLNSPELVRQMLASDANSFRKGRFYEKFRPYQGDGLFTVDGDFHQRQRRLVAPAFSRERLKGYTDVMRRVAQARTAHWAPGGEIDVRAEMYALTSEVVAKVLFGSELDEGDVERIRHWLPVFIQGMGRKVVSPFGWLDRLPTPANRRFEQSRHELRSLVDGLVRAHGQDAVDGGDLLSMLIAARDAESGRAMDPGQVRDEAMTFLTAGIETVATTLTWLYYEIARTPGAQDRLEAELDEVLGSRPVTFDDLPRLPFTQSVVRETLRLHSPAWMLMRRPTAPTVLGGVQIPAGTELLCSPATLHRDPGLYDQATQFLPDRWLTADTAGPAFLPFSAGPYKCLGDHFALTELAVTVATIGARCRLTSISARAPREIAGAALSPDRLVMTAHPRGPRQTPSDQPVDTDHAATHGAGQALPQGLPHQLPPEDRSANHRVT
ncbi:MULTISPECIES: cytochrome P450 [Streptomyces]|uniref:cytochrome P450 n=2 Tax=Streptomyces TaxID=1883 RepID=UPI00067A7D0B|nr:MULTISPECIES: cytochrome P450 [Streptomyces]MDX2918966.1 cytochrome P450 [Streptomyces sp. NE06-03C]